MRNFKEILSFRKISLETFTHPICWRACVNSPWSMVPVLWNKFKSYKTNSSPVKKLSPVKQIQILWNNYHDHYHFQSCETSTILKRLWQMRLLFQCTMTPGHFRALKPFRISSNIPFARNLCSRDISSVLPHIYHHKQNPRRDTTPKRVKNLFFFNFYFIPALARFWRQVAVIVIEPHPKSIWSSLRALWALCILILKTQLVYIKVHISKSISKSIDMKHPSCILILEAQLAVLPVQLSYLQMKRLQGWNETNLERELFCVDGFLDNSIWK